MISDTVIAVALGIGLAAACGFLVFVPMFVLSFAAYNDWLTVSDGFAWLASLPAVIAFGAATCVEIAAYYFPWVDNLLDSASTPAAVIAGVVVSAACIVEIEPLMKWSLAVIAGGGAAGTVKTGLAGVRLGATTTTGGVINPVLATVEWISSLALSILSLLVPLLAAVVALVIVLVLLRFAILLCRRFFAVRRGAGAMTTSEDSSSEN